MRWRDEIREDGLHGLREVQGDASRLSRMTVSSSNVFGLSAKGRRSPGILALFAGRNIEYREISRAWWPIPDKTSENWAIYRPSLGNLSRIGRAQLALISGTTRCTCGKRSLGERMEPAASTLRCSGGCLRRGVGGQCHGAGLIPASKHRRWSE